MAWNIITELLWRKDSQRYLRIRYEDFVREPQQWSQRMTGLAGKPQALLPFDAEGRLNVGVAHTVAGNPNRFDSGSIGIRADQEWESRIATRQRLAVTALTFPVLHRYDYPVAPSRKH